MKKITLSLLAIVFAGTMFAAGPKKAESFKVEASKSKVAWLAKKVTGQHNGVVTLTSGTLAVSNGTITGGTFTINMTSIECLDLSSCFLGAILGLFASLTQE